MAIGAINCKIQVNGAKQNQFIDHYLHAHFFVAHSIIMRNETVECWSESGMLSRRSCRTGAALRVFREMFEK